MSLAEDLIQAIRSGADRDVCYRLLVEASIALNRAAGERARLCDSLEAEASRLDEEWNARMTWYANGADPATKPPLTYPGDFADQLASMRAIRACAAKLRAAGEEKSNAPCPCGAARPCALHDTTEDMRDAFASLMKLNEAQRGRVLVWFCRWCHRYTGPGDTCYCENDD